MSQRPQEEPFSEAHLDSPEYRERLMRKLNCLIAVLEVATAKVRQNLAGPCTERERLTRICGNLQSTLEVCIRARTALERRQSGTTPPAGPPALPPARADRPRGRSLAKDEFTSDVERRRFGRLKPIDWRMVADCDLDELARRLQQ